MDTCARQTVWRISRVEPLICWIETALGQIPKNHWIGTQLAILSREIESVWGKEVREVGALFAEAPKLRSCPRYRHRANSSCRIPLIKGPRSGAASERLGFLLVCGWAEA